MQTYLKSMHGHKSYTFRQILKNRLRRAGTKISGSALRGDCGHTTTAPLRGLRARSALLTSRPAIADDLLRPKRPAQSQLVPHDLHVGDLVTLQRRVAQTLERH